MSFNRLGWKCFWKLSHGILRGFFLVMRGAGAQLAYKLAQVSQVFGAKQTSSAVILVAAEVEAHAYNKKKELSVCLPPSASD